MLLAEELECDWKKVRTEFAPINPTCYGGAMQGTFGSQAVRTSWTPMRRTGAAAREMLIQAAAAKWGVDKSMCRAENSTVVNTSTNERLSYGSLADAAAKLPVPANPALKEPSQFRLLGKPMKRRDTAAKSSGQADVRHGRESSRHALCGRSAQSCYWREVGQLRRHEGKGGSRSEAGGSDSRRRCRCCGEHLCRD